MAAPVEVVNGEGGRRYSAKVNEYFSLRTAAHIPEVLAPGTKNRVRYFNDYAYNGASFDMAVDGSATPVSFTIEASPDYDIYITTIQILLASNSIANNKFGDIAALTNGWSLFVTEQGEDTYILDSAKTTGEMSIRAGGTFTDLANWNAANDNARSISIDISKAFPFDTQRALRIGRGSKDKITAYVQDNLSTLSEFTVRGIGARHYP